MGFAAPVWLLGLLPWAAVVIYLLPGRGRPAVVPFIGLWRASSVVSRRRARRWPGVSVLIILLALLLAVLAAAKPEARSAAAVGGRFTIILDRGATMAVPGASGRRFRDVLGKFQSEVGNLSSRATVWLVPVPGQGMELAGDSWLSAAAALPATVLPVNIDQAVADELMHGDGPVIVLSDQKLASRDRRVVQIVPEPAAATVAITAMAARSTPRPQVMVRIENRSDAATVQLTVTSGKARVAQAVPLPPRGQSVDQFVDLPSLGPAVAAEINSASPENPWGTADVVQQTRGIRIVSDPALDEPLRRIAAIYTRDRPADADAPRVLITTHRLGDDQSGIWISGGSALPLAGPLAAVPNDLTRDVLTWPALGAGESMPSGFSAVVSRGDKIVIAVRNLPSRQIWINADLSEWEKTADFVGFMANAFDWLADVHQQYASVPPQQLGADWRAIGSKSAASGLQPGEWPGLYQSDSTGRLIAVNAGKFPMLDQVRAQISPMADGRSVGSVGLGKWSIIGSLACLLIAGLMWDRRK